MNDDLNKPIFGQFSKFNMKNMKQPVDAYKNPLILKGRNTIGSSLKVTNNDEINTNKNETNLSKSLNQRRSFKKPQSGYHRSRN